jgi:hypothetical protein
MFSCSAFLGSASCAKIHQISQSHGTSSTPLTLVQQQLDQPSSGTKRKIANSLTACLFAKESGDYSLSFSRHN